MGKRPLEKATWAGAVDPVGGETLAWLTRTMNYGGSIANSGLTAGVELHTTVLPFILRGVNLLGIDSVMCPAPLRAEVWRRLASDMKPSTLKAMARLIDFEGLPAAFAALLKGEARGRTGCQRSLEAQPLVPSLSKDEPFRRGSLRRGSRGTVVSGAPLLRLVHRVDRVSEVLRADGVAVADDTHFPISRVRIFQEQAGRAVRKLP